MKLRHIKRATQRRMFSPEARWWRATVQFGRDLVDAGVEALKAYEAIPERIKWLIENLGPEPGFNGPIEVTSAQFEELKERFGTSLRMHPSEAALTGIRIVIKEEIPGSSATPDGAQGT